MSKLKMSLTGHPVCYTWSRASDLLVGTEWGKGETVLLGYIFCNMEHSLSLLGCNHNPRLGAEGRELPLFLPTLVWRVLARASQTWK